ncbi:ABC transporter ATP-binding protein [Agrobacterium tumefaciens]|uniref:ABC transporter ATP-binding protein n=1 Tax=Agrobacterium tumefaciens TaxID=358 RepID=UPI0015729A75|nr:ATP-binding cassette domain-containing protein [Agrobacterium tumefaciens]NTE68234.1 ABC transporter ATP-binding protein [Agrobacterium tumefaciens]
MAPIVEVQSLTKVFNFRGAGGTAVKAVDDVSFTVAPGTCLGIVGESGSGKSTVARMLFGLERPTSGVIRVCGMDRSVPAASLTERKRRARQMQMVFQDPFSSLDRRQSGTDCLDEVLRIHFDLKPDDRKQRIASLADRVGLTEAQLEKSPRQLSGGQCQRLSIARALAAEPSVLVLDESVSALDVSVQAHLLNQLAEIQESTGITQIFISHDLAVINQVTDTVVVMRNGKIVESGATGEVLGRPKHEYTQRLRDSVPGRGWSLPSIPVNVEE